MEEFKMLEKKFNEINFKKNNSFENAKKKFIESESFGEEELLILNSDTSLSEDALLKDSSPDNFFENSGFEDSGLDDSLKNALALMAKELVSSHKKKLADIFASSPEQINKARNTNFKIVVAITTFILFIFGCLIVFLFVTSVPLYVFLGGAILSLIVFVMSTAFYNLYKKLNVGQFTKEAEEIVEKQREETIESGLYDGERLNALYNIDYHPKLNQFLVQEVMNDTDPVPLSDSLAAYLINTRLGKANYTLSMRHLEKGNKATVSIEGKNSESKITHQLIKRAVNQPYLIQEIIKIKSPHTHSILVRHVKHLAALLDYTMKYPLKDKDIKYELISSYLFAILNSSKNFEMRQFNEVLCYLALQEMEHTDELLTLVLNAPEPKNWHNITLESFSTFRKNFQLALSHRFIGEYPNLLKFKSILLDETTLFQLTLKNLNTYTMRYGELSIENQPIFFDYLYKILATESDENRRTIILNAYDAFGRQKGYSYAANFNFYQFLIKQNKQKEETILKTFTSTAMGALVNLESIFEDENCLKSALNAFKMLYQFDCYKFEDLLDEIIALNRGKKTPFEILNKLFLDFDNSEEIAIKVIFLEKILSVIKENNWDPFGTHFSLEFIERVLQVLNCLAKNKSKATLIYNTLVNFLIATNAFENLSLIILEGSPREKINTLISFEHSVVPVPFKLFLKINAAYTQQLFPEEENPDRRDLLLSNQLFTPFAQLNSEGFCFYMVKKMESFEGNEKEIFEYLYKILCIQIQEFNIDKSFSVAVADAFDLYFFQRNPSYQSYFRFFDFLQGKMLKEEICKIFQESKAGLLMHFNPDTIQDKQVIGQLLNTLYTEHFSVFEALLDEVILKDVYASNTLKLKRLNYLFFVIEENSPIRPILLNKIFHLLKLDASPFNETFTRQDYLDNFLVQVTCVIKIINKRLEKSEDEITILYNQAKSFLNASMDDKAQIILLQLTSFYSFILNPELKKAQLCIKLKEHLDVLTQPESTQHHLAINALNSLYSEEGAYFNDLLHKVIEEEDHSIELKLKKLNEAFLNLKMNSKSINLEEALQNAMLILLIKDFQEKEAKSVKILINQLLSGYHSNEVKLNVLTYFLSYLQKENQPQLVKLRFILIQHVFKLFELNEMDEISFFPTPNSKKNYLAIFKEQVAELLKDMDDEEKRRKIYTAALRFLSLKNVSQEEVYQMLNNVQHPVDKAALEAFLVIKKTYDTSLYPEIKNHNLREPVRLVLEDKKKKNKMNKRIQFILNHMDDEKAVLDTIKAFEIYALEYHDYTLYFDFLMFFIKHETFNIREFFLNKPVEQLFDLELPTKILDEMQKKNETEVFFQSVLECIEMENVGEALVWIRAHEAFCMERENSYQKHISFLMLLIKHENPKIRNLLLKQPIKLLFNEAPPLQMRVKLFDFHQEVLEKLEKKDEKSVLELIKANEVYWCRKENYKEHFNFLEFFLNFEEIEAHHIFLKTPLGTLLYLDPLDPVNTKRIAQALVELYQTTPVYFEKLLEELLTLKRDLIRNFDLLKIFFTSLFELDDQTTHVKFILLKQLLQFIQVDVESMYNNFPEAEKRMEMESLDKILFELKEPMISLMKQLNKTDVEEIYRFIKTIAFPLNQANQSLLREQIKNSANQLEIHAIFLKIEETYTALFYPYVNNPDVRSLLVEIDTLSQDEILDFFLNKINLFKRKEPFVCLFFDALEVVCFEKERSVNFLFELFEKLQSNSKSMLKYFLKTPLGSLIKLDIDQKKGKVHQKNTAKKLIKLYKTYPNEAENFIKKILQINSENFSILKLKAINYLLEGIGNKGISLREILVDEIFCVLKYEENSLNESYFKEVLLKLKNHIVTLIQSLIKDNTLISYEKAISLYNEASNFMELDHLSNVNRNLLDRLKLNKKFYMLPDLKWLNQEEIHLEELLCHEKLFLAGYALVEYFKIFKKIPPVNMRVQAIWALIEYAKKTTSTLKEQRILLALLIEFLSAFKEDTMEDLIEGVLNGFNLKKRGARNGLALFLFKSALNIINKEKEEDFLPLDLNYKDKIKTFKVRLWSENHVHLAPLLCDFFEQFSNYDVYPDISSTSSPTHSLDSKNVSEGYELLWEVFLDYLREHQIKAPVFVEEALKVLIEVNPQLFPKIAGNSAKIIDAFFNVLDLKIKREKIVVISQDELLQTELIKQIFLPMRLIAKKLLDAIEIGPRDILVYEKEIKEAVDLYQSLSEAMEIKKNLFDPDTRLFLPKHINNEFSKLALFSREQSKEMKKFSLKIHDASIKNKKPVYHKFIKCLKKHYSHPYLTKCFNFYEDLKSKTDYLDCLEALNKINRKNFGLNQNLIPIKSFVFDALKKQVDTEKDKYILSFARFAKLIGLDDFTIFEISSALLKETSNFLDLKLNEIKQELDKFEVYDYLKSEKFESDKQVIHSIKHNVLNRHVLLNHWNHLFLEAYNAKSVYYKNNYKFKQDVDYQSFEAICARVAAKVSLKSKIKIDLNAVVFDFLENAFNQLATKADACKCIAYIQQYTNKHWPRYLQEKLFEQLKQPKEKIYTLDLEDLHMKCPLDGPATVFFDRQVRAFFSDKLGKMQLDAIAYKIIDLSRGCGDGFISFFEPCDILERKQLLRRFVGSIHVWACDSELTKGGIAHTELGHLVLKEIYRKIEVLIEKQGENKHLIPKQIIEEIVKELGINLTHQVKEIEMQGREEYTEGASNAINFI